MTTVMRAAGPAEFLGMIPLLAGFTPARSIVLVPFEGGRAHGAMRIDVPPDAAVPSFAPQAIALLERMEQADAVAIVTYTDESAQKTADGLVLPHAVLVDLITLEAEAAGFPVVDALCVTPAGWASYRDREPCLQPVPPVPGVPDEITDVRVDQDAGTELPVIDFAEKERIGRALIVVREAVNNGPGRGADAGEASELLDRVPTLAEQFVRDPDGHRPIETAAMLWLLERPLFRDAVLVQWATNRIQAPDAMHGRMLAGEGERPDPARLQSALRAARLLAAQAPRPMRTGPLAIAAWMSWASGRSSHAARYLERLREIDPDYSFAHLMTKLLATRPLPDWAFQRPAT